MTTMLTIGFGDIVAQNMSEKLFTMLLMCVGILSFSFATGTLSSIIISYDHKEAALKEKITTLNTIQK
jgi:Ion channel